MIPYTLMDEYIRNSICRYDANVDEFQKKNIDLIPSFVADYTASILLFNYGWKPIVASFRHGSFNDPCTQRFAYYNEEYRIRIDLYYDKKNLNQFMVDWRIVDFDYNYKNVFYLYCVLKYGGNLDAAAYHFIQLNSKKDKRLFEHFNFDNRNLEYTSPPPPIGIEKLYEHGESKAVDQQKLTELENTIADLSKQFALVRQIVSLPAVTKPQTQITESHTANQTDGLWNQQYSQAHYTSIAECQNNNYFDDTGIPIGYYAGDNPFQNDKVYYQGETHLITIAPTGSGKLTSVQIPTLMEYTGSMVVIDPKGECAIISARQRQRLGQKVIIINPFETLKNEFNAIDITEFQGFNPLAFLNSDDDNFVADVSALAESLVLGDDIGNSDPYWSNSARDLISCLIMYVCVSETEKANKHLGRVREILTLRYVSSMDAILADDDKNSGETLTQILEEISTHSFLPMAQKARRFLTDDRSNLSVISTAISNTLFIDDPKIVSSLKKNDFNFKDLKTEKITVYIILPAKFLLAYSRWFRLLITSALDTMMSTHEKSNKSVLFMLDEFPILGYMSSIETAVGLARGYGIQLWMFFQDIHQLKHLYKDKAESFLANTGMQQYFVPNDLTTAEKISKRMGNTTLVDNRITSDTVTDAYGRITPNAAVKMEFTHKERPLMYPIEIMSMKKNKQIVFFSGNVSPIMMNKNYYYEHGKYLNDDNSTKYDTNPYWTKN